VRQSFFPHVQEGTVIRSDDDIKRYSSGPVYLACCDAQDRLDVELIRDSARLADVGPAAGISQTGAWLGGVGMSIPHISSVRRPPRSVNSYRAR
jgi:hypothetical protein